MKRIIPIIIFLFPGISLFAQTSQASFKLIILDNGLVQATVVKKNPLKASPTGFHHFIDDLEVVRSTDSIPLKLKQHFGVIYIIKSKDTTDLNIITEWIYPSRITNKKGESYKSIRYTILKPTNTPTASLYTLDEPYEMVKGKWTVNLYVEKKKIGSKSFKIY